MASVLINALTSLVVKTSFTSEKFKATIGSAKPGFLLNQNFKGIFKVHEPKAVATGFDF